MNGNMKRFLEEMERLVTVKKGCLGDGQGTGGGQHQDLSGT